MSPSRCLTVLVALVAGMVAAPPSYADQPRPHTYRAQASTPLESPPVQSRELTARVANLAAPTNRAAGMPLPASAAYERFGTATFNMDFETGYVTVAGTLGAAPPSGDLPRLAVQAGVLNGTNCSGLAGELGGTFGTSGYVSDIDPIPAGWAGANCVLAVVLPNGSSTPSDALVGTLTDVVTPPDPQPGQARDPGRVEAEPRPRRLDTGQPSRSSTRAPAQARAVTVTGKGKGVKVRPGSLGYGLAPADGGEATSGTVDIRVKLTSKARKAKLTLMASSDGETVTSKVTVKATKAPAPPRPGRYESKDGDVRFTISGGKVVGFRVRTQTQCGGFPGLPTYTMNTYDFPKTKISRAGIVHDHDEGELYGVNLEMLVAGSTVTRGRFSYSGPDRCFAVETFDARRVKG